MKESRFFPRLNLAIEAADAYDNASEYLIIGHDIVTDGSFYGRRFQVVHFDVFLQQMCKCGQLRMDQLYMHEVLRGPCKVFMDLEYMKEENRGFKGNEVEQQIIQAIVSELFTEFGVEVTNICVLDASDKDKFSRHVTINMGNAMFAGSDHVLAFIQQTVQRRQIPHLIKKKKELTSFFDKSVYDNSNKSLRMYGCYKYTDTARVMKHTHTLRKFVPLGPFHVDDVTNACITQPKTKDTRLLRMPEESLMAVSKRKRALAMSTSSISSSEDKNLNALCASLAKIDLIAKSQPLWRKVEIDHDARCRISTLSKACPYKGELHSSNHIYFVVDLAKGTYKTHCGNAECQTKARSVQPTPMDDSVKQECAAFIHHEWEDAKECAIDLRCFKRKLT